VKAGSSKTASFRLVFGIVTFVVTSGTPIRVRADLFLQPGITMRDVMITRYSDELKLISVLKILVIRVADGGTVQADHLSAELGDEQGGRGFLRAGSAVLESGLDGIRTAAGTELRMDGVHLVTDGMTGNLETLEFVSTGGFQLTCQPGIAAGAPEATGAPRRQLLPNPDAPGLGHGRGPTVEPKGPDDPFWFDGRFSRCLEFRSNGGMSMDQNPVKLLSKGPGRFRIKDGAYSASGGVLIRFPLGTIACGDRVDVSWGSPETVRRQLVSKVMPGDVRRLHAAGGCHIRLTDRKGKPYVIVCDEVRYSGKTGLISLKGGYPRIDSAEGRLIASSKGQYLRINAEGRLILGPGHWQSDHVL
jgi:hypothetical protein